MRWPSVLRCWCRSTCSGSFVANVCQGIVVGGSRHNFWIVGLDGICIVTQEYRSLIVGKHSTWIACWEGASVPRGEAARSGADGGPRKSG